MLAGVLHRHDADAPLVIQFEQGVLVQIARFGNAVCARLEIERICVMELFDLQGTCPVRPALRPF